MFFVEGDGVPQNRLMKADDSCRVENAGVGSLRYVRSGSLAVSPRNKIAASCANQRWWAKARVYVVGEAMTVENVPAEDLSSKRLGEK